MIRIYEYENYDEFKYVEKMKKRREGKGRKEGKEKGFIVIGVIVFLLKNYYKKREKNQKDWYALKNSLARSVVNTYSADNHPATR